MGSFHYSFEVTPLPERKAFRMEEAQKYDSSGRALFA
jgi:hypothetical protein